MACLNLNMTTFQEINTLTKNCANTLAFSHEEAEKILFPTQDMDFNLSHDEHRIKLERLYHKEIRLKMHGSTLSEYWRNKRIPRGLRIPKPPTLCKHNKDFLRRWSEILNKCSMDLMLLIVEQVSADVNENQANITMLEDEIKSIPQFDFDSILASVKVSTEKYRDHLKEIKIKKYKRDTEDYLRNEVYPWDSSPTVVANIGSHSTHETHALTWGASGGSSRPHVQKRATRSRLGHAPSDSTGSDFTMDSDSSAQGSSPFLGKRAQVRWPHRKRNAEEVPGPQRNARPWTRSYSKRR